MLLRQRKLDFIVDGRVILLWGGQKVTVVHQTVWFQFCFFWTHKHRLALAFKWELKKHKCFCGELSVQCSHNCFLMFPGNFFILISPLCYLSFIILSIVSPSTFNVFPVFVSFAKIREKPVRPTCYYLNNEEPHF